VFDEYIGQTFNIDLRDLSRERWSLIPTPGDLIAEVRTRRLGSLTYARSMKDAEDISLFDRKRRRNIAVYASPQKLGIPRTGSTERTNSSNTTFSVTISTWPSAPIGCGSRVPRGSGSGSDRSRCRR
jgi:hypothetical protein